MPTCCRPNSRSPRLIEIAGATYVVRRPDLFPLHRRWAAWARPRVEDLDLSLLYAVSPFGASYWPNFDAPPPTNAPPRHRRGARASRRAPASKTWSARSTSPTRPAAEDAAALHPRPSGALRLLAQQMRVFLGRRDRAAVEQADRDLGGRDRATGPATGRHRLGVGVRGPRPDRHLARRRLRVHPTVKAPADIDLAGRGLLLIPSVFAWDVWPRTDPPWDPALTYQPPGIGDLWTTKPGRGDALDALIGRRRATILGGWTDPPPP